MAVRKKGARVQEKVGGPEQLAPAILLVANLLKKSANLVYGEELGLNAIQWSVIARLGEDGPMTQTEIAEKYLVDKGQLSRSAVAMARRGLILRRSKTWRSIELRLSPKGRRVFAAIQRISRSHQQALIRGLSARNIQSLRRCLHVISVNATARLADRT